MYFKTTLNFLSTLSIWPQDGNLASTAPSGYSGAE